MNDDNTGDLEALRIDKQRAAMLRQAESSGGARVDIRDSRVSKVIEWIWAGLGTGVIGAVIYVGSQLGGLRDAVADTNLQVALSRQQTTTILEQLKDHELRIRKNEGDISTIQGRNLRGGPEARRGN